MQFRKLFPILLALILIFSTTAPAMTANSYYVKLVENQIKYLPAEGTTYDHNKWALSSTQTADDLATFSRTYRKMM